MSKISSGEIVNANNELLCCYATCNRKATAYDCDGDDACEECAAQSERWVILADLESGPWLDLESAARVVTELDALGYDVEIRSPRGSEAEGTYYRKSDGTLQIVGYSIPQPECLEEAVRRASQAALRA